MEATTTNGIHASAQSENIMDMELTTFRRLNNDSSASVTLVAGNESMLNFTGFPYPSRFTWTHIILSSIVATLIMLVIVAGNALVIIAIAKDRQLRGLQNWFIASLAVSDLFVGLLIMPLTLANELMGYWYFGDVMCELWLATDVLLCTASILNLVIISLDRYWSITRAVAYVRQRTERRVIIMIAIVWLLSMILCFPPLAGWKRPQPPNGNFPQCLLSQEPGYVVYSTMGSFYIPLIVMVLVYFKIFLAARARARRNLKKAACLPSNSFPNKQGTMTTALPASGVMHLTAAGVHRSADNNTRLSPTFESASDDEHPHCVTKHSAIPAELPEPTSPDTGVSGTETNTDPEAGIKLHPVGNKSVKLTSGDERRNLLSDDTDSASELHQTYRPQRNGLGQQFPQSEETDSMSDCACQTDNPRPVYLMKKTEEKNAEENLQPLLEETNAESTTIQTDKCTSEPRENIAKSSQLAVPALDCSPNRAPSFEEGSARRKRRHKNKLNKKSLFSTTTFGNFIHKPQRTKEKKHQLREDPERTRKSIARAKERRATLVLGIIMATFIGCWLPFFSIYLITSLTGLDIPEPLFDTIFWLGYCNSALNPIIYTIFNRDFRQAFHRIITRRRSYF